MIEQLAIAESFGLTSTRQFRVFLMHAQTPLTIAEVIGLSPADPAYKLHYGTLRKLMKGSQLRTNDGLTLLRFESNLKESKVLLTSRGKILSLQLNAFNAVPG